MERDQRTTTSAASGAGMRSPTAKGPAGFLRRLFDRIVTDRTHRFHLKCAAWIAFAAAFAVLLGSIWLKFESYDRLALDQRGLLAETRRLSTRLATFETRDALDTGRVEERLRELGARQEEIDSRSASTGDRAPFDIDTVLPSVVEVVCIDNDDRDTYYTGSGTVIGRDGTVLTNRHLLLSADGSLIRLCGIGFTTEPRLPPRIRFAAAVEAVRAETDLAILRITEDLEGKPLPDEFAAVDLRNVAAAASGLGLGDPIFIAGYPGIGAETFTFTQGVVSGRVGSELIKTSALIDSGTSGGAAFDARGAFVGVPSAAAQGDIGGSLGYLISGEAVDDFVTAYYGLRE